MFLMEKIYNISTKKKKKKRLNQLFFGYAPIFGSAAFLGRGALRERGGWGWRGS